MKMLMYRGPNGVLKIPSLQAVRGNPKYPAPHQGKQEMARRVKQEARNGSRSHS